MSEARVALVTVPDAEAGVRIGRTLVDERIIACVNVVAGITSVYRWEGEVQQDSEVLLILKLHASRVPELLRRVPELHPYDLPEVLVLDVVTGFEPYLNWVARESGTPDDS
jgi:periplasmic divalent cation tolerance protein